MSKDCILIKKSEYDELKKKANDNTPKELYIKYSYSYYFYGNVKDLNCSGSIDLDSNLYKQIRHICELLDSKFKSMESEIRFDQIRKIRKKFNKLGLFDRIFGNVDKIFK